MKIEIHSMMMDNLMTPFFYESIKEFAKEFEKQQPRAKKIQFYSDFFLDSKYPYKDCRFVYYPLTVIYKRGDWKIVWIFWENDESILPVKTIPFAPLKRVTISNGYSV